MRTTQFVILGLLSESPLSGYDIKKIIGTRFRFFWSESYGQIYPMLKELARKGCVELLKGLEKRAKSRFQVHAATGRRRKVYCLTAAGFEKLVDWLKLPPEKELSRFEILIKIYFGHLVSREAIIAFINTFQADHKQDLDVLLRMQEEMRSMLRMHENHPFILSTINLGVKVNKAYIEWAEETAAYLGTITSKESV
ncbi:MAG: PadR family transcriptional regulator [Spirochaetota bacterium]